MKVIVGMSGGVDSSVTAYLLKEQGYEVEGVSLMLYEARAATDPAKCCSLQAMEEAAKTAGCIGIPHSAIDVRGEFIEKVIEPFIDAYSKGITPNPCILCNRHVKFPSLIKEAGRRGAEFIATGHYARVRHSSEFGLRPMGVRSSELFKGVDEKKDQSYVLYVLRREELNRLVLPLGDKRKDEVREIARGLSLPAAKRPESQEICFIEDRNYFNFIDKVLPVEAVPGPIVDIENNKALGLHKGIHAYTVGQRKGLGISSPNPLYVVKIDSSSNTVYVGSQDAAKNREFLVEDVNWFYPSGNLLCALPATLLAESPHPSFAKGGIVEGNKGFCSGETGELNFRATVKIRSMMKDEAATISLTGNGLVRVSYDTPQWAPAPGQSAVFYNGDMVIGGGVITKIF